MWGALSSPTVLRTQTRRQLGHRRDVVRNENVFAAARRYRTNPGDVGMDPRRSKMLSSLPERRLRSAGRRAQARSLPSRAGFAREIAPRQRVTSAPSSIAAVCA